MKTINPFLNLKVKIQDVQKSIGWYKELVKQFFSSNKTPEALMKDSSKLVHTLMPGNLYFFFYDAKMKNELPYWDKFPLVLPFRKVPDGFYGINLHYLPYRLRFDLLGALQQYATDDKISEQRRLRISWDILNSMSRIAPVKACVKHYLDSHVRSKFLIIGYKDWVTAAMLPVEQFTGASKSKVWGDSREKY